MTEKQKKAQARNWNKRMLSGAASQMRAMSTNPDRIQGLMVDEIKKLSEISNQIFELLDNWQPSI